MNERIAKINKRLLELQNSEDNSITFLETTSDKKFIPKTFTSYLTKEQVQDYLVKLII